jgi:hypothetical protein
LHPDLDLAKIEKAEVLGKVSSLVVAENCGRTSALTSSNGHCAGVRLIQPFCGGGG